MTDMNSFDKMIALCQKCLRRRCMRSGEFESCVIWLREHKYQPYVLRTCVKRCPYELELFLLADDCPEIEFYDRPSQNYGSMYFVNLTVNPNYDPEEHIAPIDCYFAMRGICPDGSVFKSGPSVYRHLDE